MSTGGVISRFTARRALQASIGWSLLLGAYFASKSVGFVKAYPTAASRHALLATLGQNKGIDILVGAPHSLETVGGYVAWNCVQFMLLLGAIWGLLLATKLLRGEEESGRWELFVTAPTTARQTTAHVLRGLGLCFVLFYAILALITLPIGGMHDIAFSAQSVLFFDLAVMSGMVVFVLAGALTSQIFATRGRAAAAAAGIFGVCFALRAVGDITSASWLLNLTPLGWVEKLQPLTGSAPIWLVPLFALSALLLSTTLWLAGRRDLQASLIAESSSRRPHTALLNSPLGLSVRLSRTSITSWLLALSFLSFFYSALTKTALQALKSTNTNSPAVTKLLHESSLASAKAYLGAVFLILLLVLMAFAANLAVAIRREEDLSYLENILVRPVSRWQWLSRRMLFGVLAIISAGLAISLGAWIGVAISHLGMPISSLVFAGLNIAAAGLLAFGAGMLAYGYWPRATSFVAYGVLIWSFLLNMLSSGLQLSHWLLDTSVLNQLALAPAVNPNWRVVAIMASLSLGLLLIGASRFNQRDLIAD